MDDGLSEIMGNLAVDKCGVSCECQDCTVTELGKMVENCLVDARVKLVPSMISYRAMREKPSKYFSFSAKSSPIFGYKPPLAEKPVETPNGSKQASQIDQYFPKNEQKTHYVALPPPKTPEIPNKKPNFPRSLSREKSRKCPPQLAHSTASLKTPPKKFGRKAVQQRSTPSSRMQSLMRDYFSASPAPADENPGFGDGEQ